MPTAIRGQSYFPTAPVPLSGAQLWAWSSVRDEGQAKCSYSVSACKEPRVSTEDQKEAF